VFVFFGLVAVGGTAAVQVGFVSALAWACGIAVGALSCAILVVNNLRDIPGDTVAGKRTLAVRIGDPATRRLYAALVGVALAIPAVIAALGFLAPSSWPAAAVLGLGAVPLAVQPLRDVRLGARGPALVAVLVATGRLLLVYGVLLAAGIAIGALTA
jgi:1,4-dihydroxy-2-naphthoate octaprenyltransferase